MEARIAILVNIHQLELLETLPNGVNIQCFVSLSGKHIETLLLSNASAIRLYPSSFSETIQLIFKKDLGTSEILGSITFPVELFKSTPLNKESKQW